MSREAPLVTHSDAEEPREDDLRATASVREPVALRPEVRAVEGFVLSTDLRRLDHDFVHHFLADVSYWARHISRPRLVRALENSVCVGAFEIAGGRQVGFARAVTDRATFAWVADVFVDPAYRNRGLAAWMVETLRELPELDGLRCWLLATRDAGPVYQRVGFQPVEHPERFMEIRRPHRPGEL